MTPTLEPSAALVAHSALRRDDPVPLHQRLREDLRERIAQGEWQADQRLPSEAALVRRYAVSRITVRQALQALELDGVIVTVASKGSFVARSTPVQQLARLEGLGESVAAQGRAVLNHVIAAGRALADRTVAARLGLEEGAAVTHIERVRLVDGMPVSLDRTWLPIDLGDRLVQGDLAGRDIFVMIERDLATPLGHADLGLHAMQAPPLIARRLGVEPGSALLRVERLTHDRHGRPIDHEILYCRTDRLQWRLRIDRHAGALQ